MGFNSGFKGLIWYNLIKSVDNKFELTLRDS